MLLKHEDVPKVFDPRDYLDHSDSGCGAIDEIYTANSRELGGNPTS